MHKCTAFAPIFYNSVSQSNGLNYFSSQIENWSSEFVLKDVFKFVQTSWISVFVPKLTIFVILAQSYIKWYYGFFKELIFLQTWDFYFFQFLGEEKPSTNSNHMIRDWLFMVGKIEELKSNTLWIIPTCWFNSCINSLKFQKVQIMITSQSKFIYTTSL